MKILALSLLSLALIGCGTDLENPVIPITSATRASGATWTISYLSNYLNAARIDFYVGPALAWSDTNSADGFTFNWYSGPAGVTRIYAEVINSNNQAVASEQYAIITTNAQGSDDTNYNPGAGWTLEWEDGFNGTTLETTKWSWEAGYTDGIVPAGWGNDEWQNYNTNNAFVHNGNLVLMAFHGNGDPAKRPSTAIGQIQSGRIHTYGKYTVPFETGIKRKVVARIMMPQTKSMFAAFWMLGNNRPTEGWPKCGEIDIVEMIGGGTNDHTVYNNYFFYDDNISAQGSGVKATANGANLSDAYHTYEVEWDQYQLVYRFDGTATHTVSISGTQYDEFRQSFYIIFDLAIGGNWAGGPDGTTVWPQRMYVDWVRVYTKPE